MSYNNIQPILLGSDFNAYGMARSFYDKYNIKSIAYASTQLAPTKDSQIISVNVIPNFNEDPVFIETMRKITNSLDQNKKYLLISCSDGYTELVSKHLDELKQHFICPYINEKLAQKLINKVNFYEVCEEYGLPYPKTQIIDQSMVPTIDQLELPFEFPVALKPANSVEWLEIDFEGRKKAFTIKSREELNDLIKTIYQAGYTDKMICQEFIPGDDSKMRALNAYVDQNHNVRMMCLGHPLLEDPSPYAIGNYMVITPDYNEDIYQTIKTFLEKINYTGFANFDMKYDERDGKYKLFEINLRQGRSSFYCTLNGYNLAQYVMEDYIDNKPFSETIFGKGTKVWLNVPLSVFKQYATDNEDKKKALQLIKKGHAGTTAFYKKDKSFMRNLRMRYAFYRLAKNYKLYFHKNKEV